VHRVLPAERVECALSLRRRWRPDHLDELDYSEAARDVRFLVSNARVGRDQPGEAEQHAGRERIDSVVARAIVNDLEQLRGIAGIDRGHVPKIRCLSYSLNGHRTFSWKHKPSFLVETFLARGAAGERQASEQRASLAAETLTREGTRVRFGGSIHVPEDEICFFTFEASGRAAAVAAQRAGIEPIRVVEALSSGKE
jgi:hypothetical protein